MLVVTGGWRNPNQNSLWVEKILGPLWIMLRKPRLSDALQQRWWSWKRRSLSRCRQTTWNGSVCVGQRTFRLQLRSLSRSWMLQPPTLPLTLKRISGGSELPGLGGEQVRLLRSPLPVRRRAPGLQPSGVNLSDCQAKYGKRLAITETVKGHTQFPELFTQLEAPHPFFVPDLPRIGRIKMAERGRALLKYLLASCGFNPFTKQLKAACLKCSSHAACIIHWFHLQMHS